MHVRCRVGVYECGAAVRTVQGCGERVQYLEKLSRTALEDMQPVRASFTRSGPNRETVSVGA